MITIVQFRHALCSVCPYCTACSVVCAPTRILIHSPDIDTYNIGLGLLNSTGKQYILQFNVLQSSERKYIYLNIYKYHYSTIRNQQPFQETSSVRVYKFYSYVLDYISFFLINREVDNAYKLLPVHWIYWLYTQDPST